MFIEEYARGYIYRLTFGNGKVYIGQTIDFGKRLAGHKKTSKRGKSRLYNAWRKHGDPVAAEVIFVCHSHDTKEFEVHFVAEYNSLNSGYNSTEGGDDSPMNNPETRAKQKAALNRPDVKAVISERSKRMHADPAFKAVISEHLNKMRNDPTFKAAMSERSKKMNADPVFRAAHSERMKKQRADPSFKSAHTEMIKNLHATNQHMHECHAVSVYLDGQSLGVFRSTRKAFSDIGLPDAGHVYFRGKLKAAHRNSPGASMTFNAADGKEYVFRLVSTSDGV